MLKAGIIGLGKMGLSHCAILNAQPDVDLAGVCDKSKFLTWVLSKYGNHRCFDDYKKIGNRIKKILGLLWDYWSSISKEKT